MTNIDGQLNECSNRVKMTGHSDNLRRDLIQFDEAISAIFWNFSVAVRLKPPQDPHKIAGEGGKSGTEFELY
jgi:hypothetical protein